MDGTLTEPLLDFDQIRRDMGICSGPILEALVAMPAVDRAAAEKILHEHEQTAAEKSTLNPGCRELLEWVETAGLPDRAGDSQYSPKRGDSLFSAPAQYRGVRHSRRWKIQTAS